MICTFNRNELVFGGRIETPINATTIKMTPGLFRASLDDAAMYGGDLTRAALSAMRLRGDRKHVVVDVKVHMLKPKQCPAIPGWHTDGVPRSDDWSPTGGPPRLDMQNRAMEMGINGPRYHLLVVGECRTEFIAEPFTMDIGHDLACSESLYAEITNRVDEAKPKTMIIPNCVVVEFGWWDLHRGVPATKSEWRYLIRVTETDHLAPERDLRNVLRSQQNVYISGAYGW